MSGCELVCPFHGWQFDAADANTLIPYSQRTNGRARLRSYPVVERNGLVMAWYHPQGDGPLWEIPHVPEFDDDPEWFDAELRYFTIDTLLLGCATPIETDRCEMRFTFKVCRFADDRATRSVGEAAINEISRQLLEDKPIWEHEVFVERPALADTDGPFMQFRQWAGQFYVTGSE